MYKSFPALSLAFLLTACGSGAESPSIDVDLSEFKGGSEKPALTAANIINFGDVTLNTRALGSIQDRGEVEYKFSTTTDKLVAVFLTSAAEDLGIYVSGPGASVGSDSDGSNEAFVFQAQANQQYAIGVESYEGGGSLTLTVTEATRGTLGLSENEYLYEFTDTGEETCDGQTNTYTENHTNVINFKDGYMADATGMDRAKFNNVNGMSFRLKEAESGSDEDHTYSYVFEVNLTLDPSNGNVTGVVDLSSTYTDLLEGASTCTMNISTSGAILL